MITFKVQTHKFKEKGQLAYEYNPFRNYRLDEDCWLVDDLKLLTGSELNEMLKDLLGSIVYKENKFGEYIDGKFVEVDIGQRLDKNIIKIEAGEVTDLSTEELEYSLNSPVQMLPQYSYDNSVDIIMNDGEHKPRIINSRFSATKNNEYLVVDRKGDNDTNLYTRGIKYDLETSLYKSIRNIPKLTYLGTEFGGSLSVGNYHFYLKYLDADGNETDFILESGLISVFIGSNPGSIRSGLRNENSHKLIRLLLTNTDPAYKYLNVYYTLATGDVHQEATVNAYKISTKFELTGTSNIITITGYEPIEDISLDEINLLYQLYDSIKTQAVCKNRLFIANVTLNTVEYPDLEDISLRFLPFAGLEKYDPLLSYSYKTTTQDNYYNTLFIYNKTGYWDDEFYRFGIVYIYPNGKLSPVFNIRGNSNLTPDIKRSDYLDLAIKNRDGERQYFKINDSNIIKYSDKFNENSKGVIKLNCNARLDLILYLKFLVLQDVLKYLADTYKIQGFFFVRLKRIPTTLCLLYTIGIDKESRGPVVKVGNSYVEESFISHRSGDLEQLLVQNFKDRLYTLDPIHVRPLGAFCPDYDINPEYYNNFFTGLEFVVKSLYQAQLNMLGRHIFDSFENVRENKRDLYRTHIVGLEDGTKLASIDGNYFSARIGEAELPEFRFIGAENTRIDATNIVRGVYGPYLGVTGLMLSDLNCYFDVKIPGYSDSELDNYLLVRYNDKSPFYAVSDRIDLLIALKYQSSFEVYRGDCYICQFTHRINRNFTSAGAPTNDTIVEPKSWKERWIPPEKGDDSKFHDMYEIMELVLKVNLGDINAVNLGMWITLIVKSTNNLNIRSLDPSYPDEKAIYGHARGFYPYFEMSAEGGYKLPEALCINKGFEKGLSERYNFELTDYQFIKNEFSDRIAYSDVLVKDLYKNSFRIFRGQNYRDYTKTYGSITKLIEVNDNLLCVFEHGIALIPINERAVAANGDGGYAYINTSNVLPETPRMITDTFGSQWVESIIKTAGGIYGVDSANKKIWYTNGTDFKLISDWAIESFLISGISLKERELTPIIGIRNIKTHYNKNKGDVMFTFYDNLEGLEETAWNVCWNEYTLKWTTFYSWLPSYSENIRNSLFSFDRNTSKKIAKLGVSKHGNQFSEGITLESNIIPEDVRKFKSKLYYEGENLVEFKLVGDNYKNWKNFLIRKENTNDYYLTIKNSFDSKQDVIYLNVEAAIHHDVISDNNQRETTTLKYYTVALIFEKDLEELTTAFWKHGQTEIIDTVEKPLPTKWYDKPHPFEIEFVVNKDADAHKIFDNLQIISNSAEPESFHYEIVGDCYEFAKDKKNMYIRQEATKELYQYNGSDITYNKDYKDLEEEHRPIPGSIYYDKSTILPLYYSRLDSINEIEDYYHEKKGPSTKDYSALAGGEIKYNPKLNEFRIVNHAKAVDMQSEGRMRGNMWYNEDKWYVQINPLNIVQKNEPAWNTHTLNSVESDDKIPVEIGLSPIPEDVKTHINNTGLSLPPNYDRGIVQWGWEENQMDEAKLKDKFIKIRVRYSGEKLAIISAIRTLYSISYS